MTARHWYPFYPSDYARDTRDLSWDQHAAYRLLLDATWERDSCSLPNDLIRIRRMLPAIDLRTFKRLVPYILERFFYLNDEGEWVNKRLLKERQKADNASLKHSENIKKRWENKGTKDTSVIPLQPQPQPDKKEKKEDAPAKRRSLAPLADDWQPDWELSVAQEAELTKMRDWAKANAARKADWLATFRNWLRRANIPLGNVVAMREVIHVQEGSPEMAAWDSYLRKTTGMNAIRSKHGGYFPPTRWPPGHEEVA